MINLTNLLNFRFHERSCFACKFYRRHMTGCTVTICLVLGRELSTGDSYADRARTCDYWKKRSKNWNIDSRGENKNPYWEDPYFPREKQQALKQRLSKQAAISKKDAGKRL